MSHDKRLSLGSYTPFGFIQDSSEVNGVIRVGNSVKIGKSVLDFFTFIKLRSPDHPVRYPPANKHLFDRARLGVSPVENRDILRICNTSINESIDFLPHIPGLILLGISNIPDQGWASACFRP